MHTIPCPNYYFTISIAIRSVIDGLEVFFVCRISQLKYYKMYVVCDGI